MHMHIHLHTHNAYRYAFTGTYACMHACMQTYRHTDIQTYRHACMQHTDIQTYRHTDIQTYIHPSIHPSIHTYILHYIYIQTNNIRICLYKRSSKNQHLGINMFPPCYPPFCGAILNLGTCFVFFLVWTVLRSQQQCISQVLFFLSTANRWHGLLSWKDRQCLFWWNVLLKSHRSARKYHSSLPFGPDSWLS